MAYHRGQNSTFEFDVVVYNFYLDLQLNIQVSYFSTLLVDLTLFVSRFNFVVRSIQHSSLRNSTFNFRKYPTTSQSMTVSVGSANYQITPLAPWLPALQIGIPQDTESGCDLEFVLFFRLPPNLDSGLTS